MAGKSKKFLFLRLQTCGKCDVVFGDEECANSDKSYRMWETEMLQTRLGEISAFFFNTEERSVNKRRVVFSAMNNVDVLFYPIASACQINKLHQLNLTQAIHDLAKDEH
jgi:hypothetical protein